MVCLWQGKVTLKRAGTPMLAFQVLGNHGYFFKRQAVAKAVFRWEMKDESNREQLKRKYKQDRVWERPLRWEPATTSQQAITGHHHYFCHQTEVDDTRRSLLI